MGVEPLRYGIIGAGMMGGEHALDLAHLPGAEVVALADPVESSLEWTRACVGRPVDTYRDHRALLERDDLDVVVIATPNDTHRAILDDVLATDLAVLVEKPLCTTVADCLEVRRRAADRDAMTWVGLEYRYIPVVASLLDQVRNGAVGEVKMVSIREHRFPFLTKVGDWNRFNERTGGTLVEKCCHFFDLMRLALKSDPVRVMAMGGQAQNHQDEAYEGHVPDIFDHGYVIVEFASGMRAMLELCMFAEGARWQEEISAVGHRGKIEALVPGPGRFWPEHLGAPPVAQVIVSPREPKGPEVHEIPVDPTLLEAGDHNGSTFYQHQRFLEVVRGERPAPEVSIEDGRWAVLMGMAAQRSMIEGRAVDLSEFDA